MRVSIIIPTLNEAAGLPLAIDRAWGAGADEVIVVDGGSSDGTLEIAEQARCMALASTRGRATQQNRGAAAAEGDVLLFLHADTWLEPGCVQTVRNALCAAGVVGGSFRQRIESPRWAYRWLEWGNNLRARRGRPYGDQGIFVRREVFHACGGFPEVPLMEDVLLTKKFRRRGKLVLIDGPIHISPRRWERYGVVRQTVRNWLLLTGLKLGMSPERLAEFYPPHAGASRTSAR